MAVGIISPRLGCRIDQIMVGISFYTENPIYASMSNIFVRTESMAIRKFVRNFGALERHQMGLGLSAYVRVRDRLR